MQKIYITLLLSLLTIVGSAQNIDSTTTAKSSFFKSWRVAGASLSLGVWYKFNASPIINTFDKITSSHSSKSKLFDDLARVKSYTNFYISESSYENQNAILSFRTILKPKQFFKGDLKNYVEITLGVLYREQNFTAWLYGKKQTSETTYESYGTSYAIDTKSLNGDGLITLQTPGFFNLFSLYSGLGLFAGANFDNTVNSETSIEYRGLIGGAFSRNTDTVTRVIPSTNDFHVPRASLGFYIPVGLKVNLAKRSNLFVEYTFNRTSIVFSNFRGNSTWYKGFSFGYRYKFAKPEKKEKLPFNTPANPPKPFY